MQKEILNTLSFNDSVTRIDTNLNYIIIQLALYTMIYKKIIVTLFFLLDCGAAACFMDEQNTTHQSTIRGYPCGIPDCKSILKNPQTRRCHWKKKHSLEYFYECPAMCCKEKFRGFFRFDKHIDNCPHVSKKYKTSFRCEPSMPLTSKMISDQEIYAMQKHIVDLATSSQAKKSCISLKPATEELAPVYPYLRTQSPNAYLPME
jgi:hypothetical protein